MKASLNELRSLLKQAFEGCGLDQGAYESAADLALWAETHGLSAFDCLLDELVTCQQNPQLKLEIQDDQPQFCQLDIAGESLLKCGAILSDVVSAKALESGLCFCQASNVKNPRLLAKALVDAWQWGLTGMLYWPTNSHVQVIQSAAPDCINYHQYPAQQVPGCTPQGLVLVYAREPHQIEQHQNKHWQNVDQPTVLLSADQARDKRQQALNQGLEVSDSLWTALCSIAENVLVESTEQSRKGAGA